MGNYSDESAASFWERAEATRNLEQTGPFLRDVLSLEQSLTKYREHLTADTIGGSEVLRTPAVTFWHKTETEGNVSRAKAFAFINKRTGETRFALDPNVDTPEMHRFKVTSTGYLLNLDELDAYGDSFGSTDDDKALFSAAVKEIANKLQSVEAHKWYARKQRKVTITKWAGGITAATLVAGGAALGAKEWYFDPRAEDRAARIAYDAEDHTLTTKPVPFLSHEIEGIDPAEFDDIPSYRESDDLRSPRTIEVIGNECTTQEVRIRQGDSIRVGLEKGDPLMGSAVGLFIDDDQKHVTICLMGRDSPEDNNDATEESKLAVQVISPQR